QRPVRPVVGAAVDDGVGSARRRVGNRRGGTGDRGQPVLDEPGLGARHERPLRTHPALALDGEQAPRSAPTSRVLRSRVPNSGVPETACRGHQAAKCEQVGTRLRSKPRRERGGAWGAWGAWGTRATFLSRVTVGHLPSFTDVIVSRRPLALLT